MLIFSRLPEFDLRRVAALAQLDANGIMYEGLTDKLFGGRYKGRLVLP